MITIVGDTTSCLSLADAQKNGIAYIPQIIVIGEETYRDDTEMNPIQFLERQKTSPVLPKTAAPPPVMYNPIYETHAKPGDTVIVLTPSAQVSGTFRSAEVAAQEFPGADIRVIDTQIIAGGLGRLLLQAKSWVDEGLDADTVVARCMEMIKRHRVYFVVDTLEFLFKGGRIGAASALVGSLLQMKPILTFKEGHTEPFEKQLTHRRAVARLKEVILAECAPGEAGRLCIMHGNAEAEARTIAAELAPKLGVPVESVWISDLTPAILVHSGPGVIAASFFTR